MIEYTEEEKRMLEMMFENMNNILRYLEPYDVFDASDLRKLANKIEIDY